MTNPPLATVEELATAPEPEEPTPEELAALEAAKLKAANDALYRKRAALKAQNHGNGDAAARPIGDTVNKCVIFAKGKRAQSQSPKKEPTAPSRLPVSKDQAGNSWGMLFASLVETPEFQALRARNLHVLCALIASRDKDKSGECAPGRKRLKAMTGFSSRTIQRSLSALTDMGIIRLIDRACSGTKATYLVAEDGEGIRRNLEQKGRQ